MSRAHKQLRCKHRKEKKQHDPRIRLELMGRSELKPPARVMCLSYEITLEPLDRAEDKVPGLNGVMRDIQEQLLDDCQANPRAAISVLEGLLEQFPNAPVLLNWLSASLGRAGDLQGANRIARQNFEANPNYLFARVNYAQIRLEDGDLQAVDEILDKKFDLKLLYPDRDVFHISEFRAFSHLMISYWIRKGEFEPARLMFGVLEELEPDGETANSLRRAVEGSYLLELARKLAASSLRNGKVPRR